MSVNYDQLKTNPDSVQKIEESQKAAQIIYLLFIYLTGIAQIPTKVKYIPKEKDNFYTNLHFDLDAYFPLLSSCK